MAEPILHHVITQATHQLQQPISAATNIPSKHGRQPQAPLHAIERRKLRTHMKARFIHFTIYCTHEADFMQHCSGCSSTQSPNQPAWPGRKGCQHRTAAHEMYMPDPSWSGAVGLISSSSAKHKAQNTMYHQLNEFHYAQGFCC